MTGARGSSPRRRGLRPCLEGKIRNPESFYCIPKAPSQAYERGNPMRCTQDLQVFRGAENLMEPALPYLHRQRVRSYNRAFPGPIRERRCSDLSAINSVATGHSMR